MPQEKSDTEELYINAKPNNTRRSARRKPAAFSAKVKNQCNAKVPAPMDSNKGLSRVYVSLDPHKSGQ